MDRQLQQEGVELVGETSFYSFGGIQMKSIKLLSLLATLLLVFATGANAQDFGPGAGNGNGVCQFIDEDGDGFNDLAPDADGDGIPNGLDPDYVRPEDGTGNQFKWAHAYGELFRRVFGEDVVMAGVQNHWGPGDGTGDRIGDGTGGFGPGAGTGGTGSGAGDGGDGPNGNTVQDRRGSRR